MMRIGTWLLYKYMNLNSAIEVILALPVPAELPIILKSVETEPILFPI
jgi:hypothetical protein